METFVTVLDQMLFLFLCMLIGFVLGKRKLLPKDADTVISRLENYAFTPALIIHSFQNYCTVQNVVNYASYILYNLLFLGLSVGIAFLLAPSIADKKEEEGIYRYSFAMTNISFMGNSIAQGLFGDAFLFRYLIFTLPANVFIFSAGIIWMMPNNHRFSVKQLLNPMFIAIAVGMLLGLTQIPLPAFVTKAISAGAECFSPLAMVLTGFVISKFDIKAMLMRKKVYAVTAIRMLVMPLLYLLLCRVLHLQNELVILVMIFSAMPLGLNTIVFPAAYGGNTSIGAGMAIISNVIGILTVPLMLSLVL